MNKKVFKYVFMLISILMGAVTFTACGGSDDSNGPEQTPSNITVSDLLGTWVYNDESYTFISNGTFVYSDNNGARTYTGTWNLNSSTNTITTTSDGVTHTAVISSWSSTSISMTLDGKNITLTKSSSYRTIVGTWKYTFSTGYVLYTFNSDGTCTEFEHDTADNGDHTSTGTYIYSAVDNTITISISDKTESVTLTFILTWISDTQISINIKEEEGKGSMTLIKQ